MTSRNNNNNATGTHPAQQQQQSQQESVLEGGNSWARHRANPTSATPHASPSPRPATARQQHQHQHHSPPQPVSASRTSLQTLSSEVSKFAQLRSSQQQTVSSSSPARQQKLTPSSLARHQQQTTAEGGSSSQQRKSRSPPIAGTDQHHHHASNRAKKFVSQVGDVVKQLTNLQKAIEDGVNVMALDSNSNSTANTTTNTNTPPRRFAIKSDDQKFVPNPAFMVDATQTIETQLDNSVLALNESIQHLVKQYQETSLSVNEVRAQQLRDTIGQIKKLR